MLDWATTRLDESLLSEDVSGSDSDFGCVICDFPYFGVIFEGIKLFIVIKRGLMVIYSEQIIK